MGAGGGTGGRPLGAKPAEATTAVAGEARVGTDGVVRDLLSLRGRRGRAPLDSVGAEVEAGGGTDARRRGGLGSGALLATVS